MDERTLVKSTFRVGGHRARTLSEARKAAIKE